MVRQSETAIAVVLAVTFLTGCIATFVDVTPQSTIVLPGQNLSVLCKVGVPIQYCRIEIPGVGALNLNPSSSNAGNADIRYYGAGLQAGQCGAYIDHITARNNGQINCSIGIADQTNEAKGTISVLVALPPKIPELLLNPGSEANKVYKVGDILEASCGIRGARPVSNISWYLDEERVIEGLNSPIQIDNVDGLSTVFQNLTHRLRPIDHGRSLRCVAEHMALGDKQLQTAEQLNVKFSPLERENPIDLFGFELGKPGLISVEFYSNPRPNIQWTVDDERINAGESNEKYEAEELESSGRGHHKANLYIKSIKKEDTERQFILTAYNDQGSQEYYVVLSTSTEPQGVELGAGSIIAIVVSILIILLIVFLIIYARATGRWCFEGRERNIYESSDTESAHIDPDKKTNLNVKEKLTTIFKKNKEVPPVEAQVESQTPENNETKTNEEKQKLEGIVYAELDLKQEGKPVVRKEDEKTEYAEIIYTKNDDSQEANKENV